MNIRTIHSRIERREFTFDANDILNRLRDYAESGRYASIPAGCTGASWQVEVDISDDGEPSAKLIQTLEYKDAGQEGSQG